jgi:dethiobiotin synthase
MPGIFITATDTEVGKTIVTAGLLRRLRLDDFDAVSMKPIQTGGIPRVDGRLLAPDLTFHDMVAGLKSNDEDLDMRSPYVYEPACSPHLAARIAKRYPDLDRIAKCFRQLEEQHDAVLVEGAGGVYAPIDESHTMLELIKRLNLPVVIVARRGLGTINHTLLTVVALRNVNAKILGIVFNEAEPVERDFIRQDNPPTVTAFTKLPILADIDYLDELNHDHDAAWAHFDRCAADLYVEVESVLKQ